MEQQLKQIEGKSKGSNSGQEEDSLQQQFLIEWLKQDLKSMIQSESAAKRNSAKDKDLDSNKKKEVRQYLAKLLYANCCTGSTTDKQGLLLKGSKEEEKEEDKRLGQLEHLYVSVIKLIVGFLHRVVEKNTNNKNATNKASVTTNSSTATTIESVIHRFCMKCKFSLYLLVELLMFPSFPHFNNNNNTNGLNKEVNNNNGIRYEGLEILKKIAKSNFGLYRELIAILITYSYQQKHFIYEHLLQIDKYKYSKLNDKEFNDIFESFIWRFYCFIEQTSFKKENCNELFLEEIFYLIIHSLQYYLFLDFKNQLANSHYVIHRCVFWLNIILEKNVTLVQSLLKKCLLQLILQNLNNKNNKNCKNKNNGEEVKNDDFCEYVLMAMIEVFKNLKSGNNNNFCKFIVNTLQHFITNILQVGKEKVIALDLLYQLTVTQSSSQQKPTNNNSTKNGNDNNTNISSNNSNNNNWNSFMQFICNQLLFQEKEHVVRIAALKYIDEYLNNYLLFDSNNQNQSRSNLNILDKLLSSIKYDPNSQVRLKALDIYLEYYDKLQLNINNNKNKIRNHVNIGNNNNSSVLYDIIYLKSQDKDKRIRLKAYQFILTYGVKKFNEEWKEKDKLLSHNSCQQQQTSDSNYNKKQLVVQQGSASITSETEGNITSSSSSGSKILHVKLQELIVKGLSNNNNPIPNNGSDTNEHKQQECKLCEEIYLQVITSYKQYIPLIPIRSLDNQNTANAIEQFLQHYIVTIYPYLYN
ncbi:hypothetical protein ABK040_009714 [Willaertia magna]